ncbi:hypothetical protein U1Q18_034632 [Sarracenia purpurea var. burkii]
MKKKKRGGGGDGNVFLVAVQTFHGILLRRSRRLHHLLPLLSAATVVLLFVLAVISFLFPPITNSFNKGIAVRSEVEGGMVFFVPSSGGSLGRDIWSSTQSKLFYGCSNRSNIFLSAESKTHPNGYLLIATSGGLNQQRTGVNFLEPPKAKLTPTHPSTHISDSLSTGEDVFVSVGLISAQMIN